MFSGKIANGWHVYSTDLGEDGPIQATFHVDKKDGVELVGKLTPKGREISQMDPMFEMKLRYFEHSVQFVQKVKFTKPKYSIKCYLEVRRMQRPDVYAAHTGELQQERHRASHRPEGCRRRKGRGKGCRDSRRRDGSHARLRRNRHSSCRSSCHPQQAGERRPVDTVIKELEKYDTPVSNSLLYIFLAGIVGGFLALFTPCVWPIIPMTVSFFLKRNKDRRKAIREATTYGISIVVIYVALGLIVSLLFGASALNALSTNAVFNIFFSLLLVVFAASFFGAFEITLPSSWSNRIDRKSESTSGMLSIFLMAFTLSLVSFSCTGPIIGFLLVAVSTEGNIIAPTVGMFDSQSPWQCPSHSSPCSPHCSSRHRSRADG